MSSGGSQSRAAGRACLLGHAVCRHVTNGLTTAYRAITSCASELGWATCMAQDSPARSHIAGRPPPVHCQRARHPQSTPRQREPGPCASAVADAAHAPLEAAHGVLGDEPRDAKVAEGVLARGAAGPRPRAARAVALVDRLGVAIEVARVARRAQRRHRRRRQPPCGALSAV